MAPRLLWVPGRRGGRRCPPPLRPCRILEEMMRNTMVATLLAVAAAALLGACSNATGVSGSGNATMQVAAVGDDNGATAAKAPSAGQAPRFAATTASGT